MAIAGLVDCLSKSDDGSLGRLCGDATDMENPFARLLNHQRLLRLYLDSWILKQESLLDQVINFNGHDASDHLDTEFPCNKSMELPLARHSHASKSKELEPWGSHIVCEDDAAEGEGISPFTRLKSRTQSLFVEGPVDEKVSPIFLESSGSETRTYSLSTIVKSNAFESFCMVVICSNALFMAIAAGNSMEVMLDNEATLRDTSSIELGFTLFYTVEVLLRLLARRIDFFYGEGCRWNIFDTLLVGSAIQGQIASRAAESSNTGNVSYLRILRLMKLMKLLRILRVLRTLRQLRLVMNSLFGAVQSMIWSAVLCATMMFLFGTCFVQGVSQHMLEHTVDEKDRETIERFWCSVPVAMDTLWMSVTGGISWEEVILPLRLAGSHYYMIFVTFIGLFLFVISNSITSLFLDSAMQYADKDHHQVIQEQLARKREYMNKVISIFAHLDVDGSGEVTYEQFEKHMSHPHMMAFAESLEIDASDVKQFFDVISQNGESAVNMHNFVEGCIKLRGSARSMDVIALTLMHKQAVSEQRRFAFACEQHFNLLEEILPFRRSPRSTTSRSGLDRRNQASKSLPSSFESLHRQRSPNKSGMLSRTVSLELPCTPKGTLSRSVSQEMVRSPKGEEREKLAQSKDFEVLAKASAVSIPL
eukprot:TRINITY_DN9495_c0_g1_i3.p1 TRINITY_DN9495_c0_g1~~TRINITY_DN9495_c0_g1_i3.p1  ORF type:complete len:670 (-),score=92.93 TRINITY_DN9495_c0_g1_i3:156-2096(-)